jgi:hypothetical protein
MLFYLSLVVCVSILLLLGNYFPSRNNLCQIFSFIIIVFVVGLRDYVGADFDDYVDWYLLKTRDNDFEIGYLAVMNIFRWLHFGYHSLFFFISFLTYLFLFLGIRKFTKNQNLAFFIFLLIPGMFLLSFNTLRQSLAISICFYSFYFLINEKFYIYFILMLLGLSFHNTVILPFILFYLIFKYADRIKAYHVVIMLVGSLLLSKLEFVQIFGSLFKDTRYTYYFTTMRAPVPILKLVILNGVALFVLFHFKKMKSDYPYQKYLMILYFFSVIITNFFSLYGELTRFGYYFKIFEIIVIADLIFLESKKRKIWMLVGFSIYYLSIFVYTLKTDIEKDYKCKIIPYKSVLF